MTLKFERHFAGRDNAGLRRLIKNTTDGAMPACGPELERRVLALAAVVALTARGKAALRDVADDYREHGLDYEPRCDCYACTQGSLQLLGALG